MAPFTTSHYFKALTFSLMFLKTLAFDPVPLFSFADFEKDPKFKSSVALYGNAKVLNGGGGSGGIQLSGSDGRIMYKRPIKVLEGKPRQLVSFSTYFAFSMSLYNSGGLAFVIVPNGSKSDFFEKSSSGYPFELKNKSGGKSQVIGVEFSPSSGGRNWGHLSSNVAINGDEISNTSITNLVLRSGDEKLHAWIDYVASSRRLEVRLSQHGNTKPYDPFLWHSIDLKNVLKDKEFFVGFSPLKGNESQSCFLHSWSFVLRHFPHSMHSEPLDPKVLVKATEKPMAKPRSDCFLRVLSAMIFGTGCGALTAFVVLYVWTIFGNRSRVVVPEEFVMETVDDEYRKEVKIVVDKSKTIKDGKK